MLETTAMLDALAADLAGGSGTQQVQLQDPAAQQALQQQMALQQV
jgi:hypothetical protein